MMEREKSMVWIQSVIVVALLAGALPESQEHVVSYGQTQERIVGLLEMPDIFGDFGCKDFQAHSVILYPEP